MFFLIFVVSCVYGGEKTSWDYMSDADIATLVGPLQQLSRDIRNTEKGFLYCLARADEHLREGKDIFNALGRVRKIARGVYDKHKAQKIWPKWFKDFGDIEGLVKESLSYGTPEEQAFFSIVLYLRMGDFIFGVDDGIFAESWIDDYAKVNMHGLELTMLNLFSQHGHSFVFLFGDNPIFSCLEIMLAISRNLHIFSILEEWSNAKNIKAHGGMYKGLGPFLKHDEDHAENVAIQSALINIVKENVHVELTEKIISNLASFWPKRGLEMTFAGHLIIHEDYIGKAALLDCSHDLARSIYSVLDDKIWSLDLEGWELLERILGGRPISDAMEWRKELLEVVCPQVMPIDQKGRQEEICRLLSRSWGIKVSIDRCSHQLLAVKMTEKICELNHVSDMFKDAMLTSINEAFATFEEELHCFVLLDHPVELSETLQNETYSFAGFPLQETIEDKRCSIRERFLFLMFLLQGIKNAGDIYVAFLNVRFGLYKSDTLFVHNLITKQCSQETERYVM